MTMLLTNLVVMAGLTFIFGQSSKRYQVAENELKFSKILEETQQDVNHQLAGCAGSNRATSG